MRVRRDIGAQAADPAGSAAPVPDVKAAPDPHVMPETSAGAAGGAADITYVPDVSAAAAVLNRTAARAFITTGSRGAAPSAE